MTTPSPNAPADLIETVASMVSPSLFRMIPRGTKRPRGEGETTGKYRHADREEYRERARGKAREIIEIVSPSGGLLPVVDSHGFTTLHEPDEDGNPGDLVASVWRDDYLSAFRIPLPSSAEAASPAGEGATETDRIIEGLKDAAPFHRADGEMLDFDILGAGVARDAAALIAWYRDTKAEVVKSLEKCRARAALAPTASPELAGVALVKEAIRQIDDTLKGDLKGRTHDVYQRGERAGMQEARRFLAALAGRG